MYEHVAALFYSTVWALLPAKLAEIRSVLHLRMRGEHVADEEIQAIVAARRPGNAQMIGRVAVLPVMGTLAQRAGGMEQASGAVSAEEIGQALDGLVNDRTVKCVVMEFDSPGGSVFGIQELGEKIRAARDQKKIVGVADSVAASAAYWLLAQCSEVYVTPGGQVGSIGVLAAHEDLSGQQELEGVKTTLVSAGPYKVEGNPFGPLDDAARAELQSKVDHYYGQFLAAVGKGRGCSEAKVRADFGQGRMLTAAAAKSAGMVDGVATMETVLRRLGAGDGPNAAAATPQLGDRAQCSLCAEPIEYVGPYWRHTASSPRHPARPTAADPGVTARLAARRARAVEVEE